MKVRNLLAILLLVIGSTQMVGYLLDVRAPRGIGLASGVAPFPKVFCEADGYEAFAARFFVEGDLPGGGRWQRRIDPGCYAKLRGPYNRRNVYGAALAFAPRLPAELRDALLDAALEPGSAMRAELGVPAALENPRVRIVPCEGTQDGPWTFSPTSR